MKADAQEVKAPKVEVQEVNMPVVHLLKEVDAPRWAGGVGGGGLAWQRGDGKLGGEGRRERRLEQ